MTHLPPLRSGYVAPDPTQVKLNQNESPFDLSAEERALWLDELKAVALNRYPDPRYVALAERIAQTAGVTPDMVLAGNGANELIELLIRATCDPEDQVLTAAPTYHLYDRFAAMNRAELVKVGWGEPFASPKRALTEALGPRTRLLLLCRPNNPTGHLFPAEDVLELADRCPALVAVDEAYYDFCQDTLAPHVGSVPNLVVVRTLSKAYGAAGLRLGYLLAAPAVVCSLRSLQQPYPLNAVSQAAARFLLSHPQIAERQRTAILEHRTDLVRRLAAVRGITVFPSSANFLLVRTAFSADALDRHLQAHGVQIRNLNWDDHHVRISVGTPDAHARLVDAMTAFTG